MEKPKTQKRRKNRRMLFDRRKDRSYALRNLMTLTSDEGEHSKKGSLSPCNFNLNDAFFLQQRENNDLDEIDQPKPKLRVISLFDGIASGLFILTQRLNIDVECYYSSEICKDAKEVQKLWFNKTLTMLGSVTSITQRKLERLKPIHLLLGGSPCNQFSLVNPLNKSLYDPSSTNILLFDYIRIRDHLILNAATNGHEFFWLFENTCHMKKDVLSNIKRHIGSKPIKTHSTPSRRDRYFWGNIPHMHERDWTDIPEVTLQSCLDSHRTANVTILPTQTTSSHSQFKGYVAPVTENGRPSTLYSHELEQILGYPAHFTDAANLSASKRRSLLGKAWDIRCVTEVLKPLKLLFKTTEAD